MARLLSFLFLIPALLLTPIAASGQAVLTGRVISAETGAPLPDAHVFIAASMNGTVSDISGRFRLNNVPLGVHRLYASIVGYEPAALDLFIRDSGEHTFEFELERAVVELEEIEVTAERDERWQRRLEKFVRLFIGETPNADSTEILNPEILDFSERLGRFTARAAETLIIENRALGYRIQYFLKEFESTTSRVKWDGEPLFEEMTPSSPEEAARWQANRAEAYNGSFRHFMLALLDDRVDEEGFKVYQRPASRSGLATVPTPAGNRFPIDTDELLNEGDDDQERILEFHGFLEIVFTGELEHESYLAWRGEPGRPQYRTSMLLLEEGPTVVDLKGDTVDPYGVTQFGYLAFERVADDVPSEYRPWQGR